MDILKQWFETMEYEIAEITENEAMIVDYAWEEEGDIIIKTIPDWCKEFIEIMNHKINQDIENTEVVAHFNIEIAELKKLGNIA